MRALYGKVRPEEAVGQTLRDRGLTLAVVESCTGGLLSNMITDVPGSSDYFIGGVIAYSNEVKKKVIGVRPDTLLKFGAVSLQAAQEMAAGARNKLKSDIGVSITGIAGPGGGTPKKPVGAVFIAVSIKNRLTVRKFLFKGNRKSIKKQSAQSALAMLARALGLKVTYKTY